MLSSTRINEKYFIVILTVILLDIGTIGTIHLIKPAVGLTGIQTDSYPASIAIDPITHRIYMADQGSNTVSVIGNLGKVIYRVNTSAQPVVLS